MLTDTKKALACLIFTWLVANGFALAAAKSTNQPEGAFAQDSLDGWEERSFMGNTHYELIRDGNLNVLKGHTQSQASILYREQTIDLSNTPIINWSWKVDRVYTGIDEKSRNGDDFPARLYVVAQTGFLPWETLAINYVWASHAAIGDSWSNPYTEKAKMLAIESGDANVRSWTRHSRNVAKDFQQLFGTEVKKLSGYAVMVDGDNTQTEGIAWFGRIGFSAAMRH